jgi:hypothetical protein
MKKQTARKKRGPHEKLHTLYPFTFDQVLGRILAAKPKRRPAKKTGRKKG